MLAQSKVLPLLIDNLIKELNAATDDEQLSAILASHAITILLFQGYNLKEIRDTFIKTVYDIADAFEEAKKRKDAAQ